MVNACPVIPKPQNSPFVSFAKGTKERDLLQREIERSRSKKHLDSSAIPLWINGPVVTGTKRYCIVPHNLKQGLGLYSVASEYHVARAVETVLAARDRWVQAPWFMRFHIFRKAARLIETKYLIPLVTAVMEDYSKNAFEAFIDVQELIDFLNFNVYFAYELYSKQPDSNADTFNMINYSPHEGFIFAVSPNNFIAINGNLCTAPLIMGNVVIAKPSSDVVYSFNMFLNILIEAGLPRDVLAVLYGDSKVIGEMLLDHPMLAGVHFTGGTDTFNAMNRTVGQNIEKYKNYPKIVGETGGKDPIVVYDDHDPLQTATAIVVGGFGAQGRKCSATSRVYMTQGMLVRVLPHLKKYLGMIKVGDVADFRNYMGAIINEREFKKINEYINRAHLDKDAKSILSGKVGFASNGYFIPPTIILTTNPDYVTVREEIFGPVVTIVTIPEERFEKEVLDICDRTSPYALTGAVHTGDVLKFCEALQKLRYAVGNFYDDRTTAAMVNAQPFSGGRKSGTNSKVGWWPNLMNWVNMQTVCLRLSKTTFPPACVDPE
ncbi:MAG: 1-pyrroline-5-carboxylate dehydrogenase [Parcubacteria group bacterium GW2011_GWA2_47_10]|nr:MAG: 1-pyrroline-5-carboxylate dehydrogenase [Parcubacteria group bacterium GW2011_GWA2_47_10]